MVRAVEGLVDPSIEPIHQRILGQLSMELHAHGWNPVSIYDNYLDLPVHEAPSIDFTTVSNQDLQYYYALGAEIADFSCLGKGVRPYTHCVWHTAMVEMEKRGLEQLFFYDLVAEKMNK